MANKLENAVPGASRKAGPTKTWRSVEKLLLASPLKHVEQAWEPHFCILARTSKVSRMLAKKALLEAGLAPQMEKLDDRTTSQK